VPAFGFQDMEQLPTVEDLQGIFRVPENSIGLGAYDRRGFAGHIEAGSGLCEWHRIIDVQPPN
jgi:hypothetical protein